MTSMMNNDWQIDLKDEINRFGSSLFIYRRHPSGQIEIMSADGETKLYPIGADAIKPTLFLEPEMLSALLDAMKKRGIKGKEASFTEGKLVATEKHLEDMRRIVFEPAITGVSRETSS